MTSCIYAGTFDVFTNGHLHILERALKIFDKVTVVIGSNSHKKCLFTLDERLNMVKDNGFGPQFVDVKVLPDNLYLVDFAKTNDIKFLVRGIRDSMDFDYEHKLCKTNKQINADIETVYLMPDK